LPAAEGFTYRNLSNSRGLDVRGILNPGFPVKLILLDRQNIREIRTEYSPVHLSPGEQLHGVFAHSGTSSQPVK